MTKKRIVIFSLLDTPAFGGAEQYMFSCLSYLREKGYSIVLATNNEIVKREMLSRLSSEEKKTFTIIHLPYRLDAIGNWKGLLKFFIGLPLALKWCYDTLKRLSQEADQVICLWPGWSDRLVFSPIAKHFAIPLLWIEIGPLEPTFKKNFSFPKYLYRFTEKYPDHVITTSEFTRKSILKNTHFNSRDISLVYPGTKLFTDSQIQQYRRKGEAWRKEKGLAKERLFVVVARLADENEVDMVIRAFAMFVEGSTLDAKLMIVGDGPVRGELEAVAVSQNVAKEVVFLGFVSEDMKRTVIAASDYFIFPRAWNLDGFGITTIEALSLGVPVLTSDFGPQIEIVTDGQEGFRYRPHDSEDLARKMRQISKIDKKALLRMGEKGISRVKHFSEDRSHEALCTVIRSVTIET